MRHAISSRELKLESFFDRARKISAGDETQSDMARLGAVLVCGYVERSVEVVLMDRLSQKAHPRLLSFVKSYFRKGTNYDCEAICQLLARFDLTWSANMRAKLAGNEEWVSSLDSLYTVRNSIAHGGDQSQGLSGITTHFENCKKVVAALMDATK